MFNKESFLKSNEVTVEMNTDFVVEIPSEITNRRDLFNVLQDKLKLPDYFGHNWNALAERLRDLSWITQQRVAIIHRDIPVLPAKEIAEYQDILAASTKYWAGKDRHKLLVAFP